MTVLLGHLAALVPNFESPDAGHLLPRIDIWLMLLFGVVGYVFKKIGIPLAPFTLALVLGSRAEDAFRLAMIGAEGDLRVFWSNGLVGTITTLAFILLFWPVISRLFD